MRSRHSFLVGFLLLVALAAAGLRLKLPQESPRQALAIVDQSVLTDPLPETRQQLAELKKRKVYGIAIKEKTLRDLLEEGQIHRKGKWLTGDPQFLLLLRQRLLWTLPPEALRLNAARQAMQVLTQLSSSQLFLGFFPDQVKMIQEAGLKPVLRIQNRTFATPLALDSFFAHLKSVQPSPYLIFQSDQVLGFKKGLPQVVSLMKKSGFHFGRIEFAKQKGERMLQRMLPAIEWVHSLKGEAAAKLSIPQIADRYKRALNERSVRLFYIRDFSKGRFEGHLPTLLRLLDLLNKKELLADRLEPARFLFLPSWLYAGIALLLGFTLLLFQQAFFELPPAWVSARWLLLPALFLLSLVHTTAWLSPLFFAVAWPILFVLIGYLNRHQTPWVLLYWEIFFLSLLASLALHGLLSQPAYIHRLEMFHGVKLSFILPLAFSGLLVLLYFGQLQRQALMQLLDSPLKVSWAIGTAFVLSALFLLLIRTGNQGEAVTFSVERTLRLALEHLFGVRPRFKEAFIGYPSLVLFLALNRGAWDKIGVLWLPLAMLGLVSTVNTFCHLHTPVMISLIRSFLGATIGFSLGSIALLLLRHLVPSRS